MLTNACGRFLQKFIILVNLIVLLCGLLLLVVGLWTVVDKASVNSLFGSDLYVSSAIILIVVSIFVILLSFLGCYGAKKEIKCMLLTYYVLLGIIVVLITMASVLGYVFRHQIEHTMENTMQNSLISSYNMDGHEIITEAWDLVQKELRCCGVSKDFNYTAWYEMPSKFIEKQNGAPMKKVPWSCCRVGENENSEELDRDRLGFCQGTLNMREFPDEAFMYTESCLEKVKDLVKHHALILAVIASSVAFILLLAAITSYMLFKMIKS